MLDALRIAGLQAAGNEEFQQAVKRMVPTGRPASPLSSLLAHSPSMSGRALGCSPSPRAMKT